MIINVLDLNKGDLMKMWSDFDSPVVVDNIERDDCLIYIHFKVEGQDQILTKFITEKIYVENDDANLLALS